MIARLDLIYQKDQDSIYTLTVPRDYETEFSVNIEVGLSDVMASRGNAEDIAVKKAIEILEDMNLDHLYVIKVTK